jgi:hypothetical protein
MTMFNVRLGWWLGNPAKVEDSWYHRALRRVKLMILPDADPRLSIHCRTDPRHSVLPLIFEALGQTNEKYSYVYLSDGGHFDNLGVYEMIRRRCGIIVVSDASCDPSCDFEDIGNAVRKIQNDTGVRIDLREVLFTPDVRPGQSRRCAVGTIHYEEVDGAPAEPGTLIYLKPSKYLHQPIDIYNHGRMTTSFPHEPTANQWFNESQFESYRKLGFDTVDYLCSRMRGCGLKEFVRAARQEAPPLRPRKYPTCPPANGNGIRGKRKQRA